MCKSEANLSRVSLSMSEEKDLPVLQFYMCYRELKFRIYYTFLFFLYNNIKFAGIYADYKNCEHYNNNNSMTSKFIIF